MDMAVEIGSAVHPPKEESEKRVVLSQDLALTTLVAVATTIVVCELGFGRVSAAVGVAVSALIADFSKNFLIRHRVGKRPLVLVTLLLLLLSTVRDAFAAIARRRGLPVRERERPPLTKEAAAAPGPFPWRGVLVTSALATAIAVSLFTVPELALGNSLVSDRRTTFFGAATPTDREAPSLSLPSSRIVLSDKPTPVRYRVVATDERDGKVSAACTPPSGAVFELGTTTVRCFATDKTGNRANGAFAVTVRKVPGHGSRPTLSFPGRLVFEATGPSGARVPYTASASDFEGDALRPHCTRPPRALFRLGATTVTCRAVDAEGRTTRGAFTVIVHDTTPPALTIRGNLEGRAGDAAGRRFTYHASARDLVDGRVAARCRPSSGSLFPIGRTTVTCAPEDAHGNRSRRTFTVVLELVGDHEPPHLALKDVRAEATSAAGARVEYRVTAQDDVDGSVQARCSPAPGATFGLRSTTVHCTATDSARNRASETFRVTVVDTSAPRLTVPGRQTAEATSAVGARVDFGTSAVDVVDGKIKPTCSPAAGTVFPLGTRRVVCSATDRHGNRASRGFDVTVQDTTKPKLVLPDPLTAEARSRRGARVAFTVSATDLVSGPLTPTCSRRPGLFPLGTTTVSCFAVDEHGNRSSGSFRVSVVDTTPPALVLPKDFTVVAAWNPRLRAYRATISYVASARDRVDGVVPVSCSRPSRSVYTVDERQIDPKTHAVRVPIKCIAVDSRGNRASGVFTVTVTVPVVE
jgi:HYR domain